MDIPNLSNPQPSPLTIQQDKKLPNSVLLIIIVSFLAVTTGFWLSRLFVKSTDLRSDTSNQQSTEVVRIDNIQDIQVGKVYGDANGKFHDTATGTIEKGSINGEGTHILNREGGKTQRASLTSSTIDLDLFVGKKVEIKGETNTSNKTGWLLDVGTIKVLE